MTTTTTSLSFAELRQANVQRLAHFPGHDDPWSPNDWMVALVGEVGELANMLKKRRRGTGVGYPGMKWPTDQELEDELADIQTYLDLLAAELHVDLAATTVRKFNQVSERWGLPDRIEVPV